MHPSCCPAPVWQAPRSDERPRRRRSVNSGNTVLSTEPTEKGTPGVAPNPGGMLQPRHRRRLEAIARRREAVLREQREAAQAARDDDATLREIADALGVTHTAVWKWLRQPEEPEA
jgi:hypothetical protein